MDKKSNQETEHLNLKTTGNDKMLTDGILSFLSIKIIQQLLL